MRFEFDHSEPMPRMPDRTEQDVLAKLGHERPSCPDFTRQVMGRLGYMQAAPKVCRRRRVARWMQRGALCTAALVAIGAGIHVFNLSPEARRPADTPIFEAFSNDIQRQSEGLGQVIQTLQRFTPPALPVVKPEAQEPVEASEAGEGELPKEAKAPFSWI